MKLSSSNIKKIFIFSYISRNKTLHLSAQAQKTKNHPKKIFYTSGNGSPKNTSYIFSKESFSYILENRNPRKLLIFQGTVNLSFFFMF